MAYFIFKPGYVMFFIMYLTVKFRFCCFIVLESHDRIGARFPQTVCSSGTLSETRTDHRAVSASVIHAAVFHHAADAIDKSAHFWSSR